LRFEVQGIVNGRPAIVLEHVTRLRDDLAPEWPAPPKGGGYRIEIVGDPCWTLELGMLGADGDHNTGGLLATAMRLLNAIPAVCAAPPGLLTPTDLPLIPGRNLLR
jgi:4-hydroxy-tetrahydrodipicolinate reductase